MKAGRHVAFHSLRLISQQIKIMSAAGAPDFVAKSKRGGSFGERMSEWFHAEEALPTDNGDRYYEQSHG